MTIIRDPQRLGEPDVARHAREAAAHCGLHEHEDPPMSVTVVKYGVHYRWALPPVLVEQLRLVHDLREDLVTRQLEFEAAVREVWSSYPSVAAVEADLAAAEAALLAALEEVAKQKSAQRTKRITGSASETARAAKAHVKALRETRRAAIADVREHAKPRLDALSCENRDMKPLYAQYVQGMGLYWATFNDVAAHHQTAVKKVAADRKAGRPASLRHHRFDGSGTIAVQLQRGAGAPARTPAALADVNAGKWRNVLSLPWVHPDEWDDLTRSQQRHAGRAAVRMRCGDGHIEIPVQAHRMLPSDADVTGARLTVRRIAGSIRAHITITAKTADPVPVTDGPNVAVHLGWRAEPDAVVVGTWRASSPLDIPFDLRHAFAPNPGRLTGTIRMPNRVIDRLSVFDAARAQRDLGLDAIRAAVVAYLSAAGPQPHPHPRVDGEMIAASDVARWRSPNRFAWLARVWAAQAPSGPEGEQIASDLEAWRRNDRAAWESQEHGRDKALGYRTDLYQQIAAVIADQSGALVIDQTSVAQIAATDSDLPNDVERKIAHQRTAAAPGELRAAIVSACTRDGVPVITVESAGLSRMHARCGHRNPDDGRYLTRPVHCDGCGDTYDQDESATALMLARATHPAKHAWVDSAAS